MRDLAVPPRMRALLVRPRRFFAQREALSLAHALGVLLLAGAVATGAIGAVMFVVSDHLDGTVTVDNPDHVPDWACEQQADMNDEFTADVGTPAGCTEPERVERDVGALFWQAANGLLAPFFVGFVIVWLVQAGVLHLAARVAGATGGFRQTAAITAYGTVAPAVGLAVAAVLLAATIDPVQAGGSEAAVESAVRTLVDRYAAPATVLGIGTTVWQAYIWARGLEVVQDLRAGVAFGVALVVSVAFYLFGQA
jgi:hypothetical protein